MANTIDYAVIFQQAIDMKTVQAATSGWMTGNAGQLRYEGGSSIKIPKLSTNGLADYDRANNKYPTSGAVTVGYETRTMSQDRAQEFRFDRYDVDETNFVLTAGNTLDVFQREHLIPEIDAYRYSAIYALLEAASTAAPNGISDYTPDADTIFAQFLKDIYTVMDQSGVTQDGMIATVSTPVMGLFEAALNNRHRYLGETTVERGGVSFKVPSIDGIPIISVGSDRMKTGYVFGDGSFAPADGARDINWIICPRNAPIAVSKSGSLKITDPNTPGHTDGDCWVLQLRVYHDLWIPDNRLPNFIASVVPEPEEPVEA
jgi:hypothetical protein